MKAKVLIVDDAPFSLDFLQAFLGAQFAFEYANSGAAALQAVATGNPALILMDVEMPGEMNGYEACRAIKDNRSTQHIPVIFISGHTETENRLKAYESGGDDYVSKPFNIKELKHKIALALASQEKRNELAEKARHAASVAMMSMREAADSHRLQTDHPCRLRIDQRLSSGGGGQTQIGITCRRSHLCDLRCQVNRA